jgi:serine/threonine kinase PknH
VSELVTAFVSYSSLDAVAVKSLVDHLTAAKERVWMDESLRGGDVWWTRILDQLRSCDVFVVAVSENSLRSKPCRAEMQYAVALGLPIQGVLIGDLDRQGLDPVFVDRLIDYRNPDAGAAIKLVAAVRNRAAERRALPDPLPAPPPIPYEYLQRLGAAIGSPAELSPAAQEALLVALGNALRDEDEVSVRGDLAQLLLALRRRPDVTHAMVSGIDEQLRVAGVSVTQGVLPQPGDESTVRNRWWQGRRGAALAVGAAVVCAAVAGFFVWSPWPPASEAVVPPVAVKELDGLLLTLSEVKAATGDGSIDNYDTFAELIDDSPGVADKACVVMFSPGQATVYAGAGWMGVVGQILREPRDQQLDHYVDQQVVAFPQASDATKFFAASASKWAACANHRYVVTQEGANDVAWTVGDVSNVDGKLSATKAKEGGNGWACQRALTVRNNVVIDAESCSHGGPDSAITIADQIAAKIR